MTIIIKLDFVQKEPVSDVVTPATYRFFFVCDDNVRVLK